MLNRFKVPWDEIEKELEKRVEDVFLKVFDTIEDTGRDVHRLREKFPNLNEMALCHEVIKDTSTRTAVIGGSAALPDLIPGFGWGVMVASLAGDFCLTLREEMGMFLKFSFLFEPDGDLEQRKKDVIHLLLFMARDPKEPSFARETIQDLQKRQVDVLARKVLIRAGVQLGLRFFRKKLFALIPGLGIALSGGVNFLGTRQAGKLGIEYFHNRQEFMRKHGQGAVNLDITQRATVQMMINLAKMGEQMAPSLEMLEEMMEMYGYSEELKKGYREDLSKKEVTPIAIKDIKAMSQDDRRYVLKQGLKLCIKPTVRQENYLEFINRAFGLSQSELKQIRDEIRQENSAV